MKIPSASAGYQLNSLTLRVTLATQVVAILFTSPPQNSARTAHTLMRQIKLSRPPPTHTHTHRESNRTDKRVREMYIGIKGILTELLTHLLYFILKVFLNNHGFITSPFTFIGMKHFFPTML